MSQVYSVTFNGLGLTPFSQQLVSQAIPNDIRVGQSMLTGWRSIFLRKNEKDLLRDAVQQLAALQANPGEDEHALTANHNRWAGFVWTEYSHVQNRTRAAIVLGMLGLGGYLYFRKR